MTGTIQAIKLLGLRRIYARQALAVIVPLLIVLIIGQWAVGGFVLGIMAALAVMVIARQQDGGNS